ncbi:hypothetical protein Taro_002904 [Colocasia esculenta]|uniref:Uncharacterized protein n=1 Tax=Colocasia esculenta TaxID=4460 RepID=A0A843TMS7_COLES|nr:hypothetical protein [Colocasia esculenta]
MQGKVGGLGERTSCCIPTHQDMARTKTREELLAEERDYKRRRMSYRGKKVKRTTTQVIRDIIEDHMEALKQSGGVECNMKGSQDSEMLIPGSGFQGDVSSDVDMVKEKESEPSGVSSRDVFVSKKLHCAEFQVSSGVPENAYGKDSYNTNHYLKKDMRESRYVSHKMHLNSDSISVRGEHMDHEYGRPANYRSYWRSDDRYTHQREKDGKEVSWSRHDKQNSISSHSFKDYTDDSSLSSSSMTKEEYGHVAGRRKQSKGRNRGSHRSESMAEFMFEDRYDPYEDASTNNGFKIY